MDRAGRIVLPKGVRQELGLQAGDVFKVTLQGSTVALTPSKGSAGFVRKGKALVFSTHRSGELDQTTVETLLAELRESHTDHLAGRTVRHKRGL